MGGAASAGEIGVVAAALVLAIDAAGLAVAGALRHRDCKAAAHEPLRQCLEHGRRQQQPPLRVLGGAMIHHQQREWAGTLRTEYRRAHQHSGLCRRQQPELAAERPLLGGLRPGEGCGAWQRGQR